MHSLDELLCRSRAGDAQALEALFARIQEPVLGMVRSRMGSTLRSKMDSGDVQQSVLGEALRSLEKFQGKDGRRLMHWLAALVENKLRNKARALGTRKRGGARSVRLEDLVGEDSQPFEPAQEGPTPSIQIQAREEFERLTATLTDLPPAWRQVLELRSIEGLAWEEVAARTGQTIKAAQGCFARARLRLAERFGS